MNFTSIDLKLLKEYAIEPATASRQAAIRADRGASAHRAAIAAASTSSASALSEKNVVRVRVAMALRVREASIMGQRDRLCTLKWASGRVDSAARR